MTEHKATEAAESAHVCWSDVDVQIISFVLFRILISIFRPIEIRYCYFCRSARSEDRFGSIVSIFRLDLGGGDNWAYGGLEKAYVNGGVIPNV